MIFNAILLHIETATKVCSVAISKDGQLLAEQETSIRNAHSTVLTTFIDDLLKMTGMNLPAVDAVVVSEGPGSYTGLRIGVASAKGLCMHSINP